MISTLLLLPVMAAPVTAAGGAISPVRLNQLGYRPHDKKIACIADAQGAFEVVRRSDMETVLTGEISALRFDAASGDNIGYADFSALAEPGEYIIRTEAGDSAQFAIARDVYHDVAAAAFKFFTLQRCGQILSADEAGKYAHGACHTAEAAVYGSDIQKSVTGGWHDAGDYGRYISAAGKAVMDLLLAHRDYPEVYGGALLDEIRYELDWMLKMQDGESGGVYHKVTNMGFEPMSAAPDEVKAKLILSPISSTATGDFAGVCAYASTIYRESDPAYADALLEAAERAYAWLAANPDAPGFTNPPGIATGEYGDDNDSDERALAAAALYLATGDRKYQEDLGRPLAKTTGLGWADMGMYAAIIYLETPEPNRDEAMYKRAKGALAQRAAMIMRTAGHEGYRVSIHSSEYYWGSNMNVASNGMLLLIANRYAPDPALIDTAHDQLNYLLGQNANGISYITRFGPVSARKPHHRPSVKAKEAMPGMLVGGPNTGLEDNIDAARLRKLPPSRQYCDDWGAYALNEVTIYWNSPLVYLLAEFQ